MLFLFALKAFLLVFLVVPSFKKTRNTIYIYIYPFPLRSIGGQAFLSACVGLLSLLQEKDKMAKEQLAQALGEKRKCSVSRKRWSLCWSHKSRFACYPNQ